MLALALSCSRTHTRLCAHLFPLHSPVALSSRMAMAMRTPQAMSCSWEHTLSRQTLGWPALSRGADTAGRAFILAPRGHGWPLSRAEMGPSEFFIINKAFHEPPSSRGGLRKVMRLRQPPHCRHVTDADRSGRGAPGGPGEHGVKGPCSLGKAWWPSLPPCPTHLLPCTRPGM